MKDEIILKVENLSKQYRLGTVGTGTISHDFNRFLAKIRGREDPYLKIGESNDKDQKGVSEYVWALKDINFDVKKGEILGIIGKNGAGKSTLLKILSKVTSPTTGNIKSKGRIASLLEVGTGFHQEMTGKEDIFLNGAILGMTKKEISTKLDEIVSFSGCKRYIDTPVKRYSSGMRVRLAFAVAAHLEPDILVVDEVLAVGDAEFQKKAIGKMQDISSADGRTILFVSHDMAAIKNLCSRLLVLNDGIVSFSGAVDSGINFYLSKSEENLNKSLLVNGILLKSLEFLNAENENVNTIEVFRPTKVKLSFLIEQEIASEVKIELIISDSFGQTITTISSWLNSFTIFSRKNLSLEIDLINGLSFREGEYNITVAFYTHTTTLFENVAKISVLNSSYTGYKYPLRIQHGNIYTPNRWGIID